MFNSLNVNDNELQTVWSELSNGKYFILYYLYVYTIVYTEYYTH